jgi:hypothetical protein
MRSVAWCTHTQGVRQNYYEERKRADQLQKEQYSHNGARVQVNCCVRFSTSFLDLTRTVSVD